MKCEVSSDRVSYYFSRCSIASMTTSVASRHWDSCKFCQPCNTFVTSTQLLTLALGIHLSALTGLLASLEECRGSICSSEEEYGFLNSLLRSKELHALFRVHNKILEKDRNEKYRPVLASSMQIVLEILDSIIPYLDANEDFKELFFHLQKPHLQVTSEWIMILPSWK